MKIPHIVAFASILLFGSLNILGQETQNSQLQNNLNALIQNLQENPENPLKVDGELLNDLASLVSDPQQKSIIESYSKTISSDPDLSMRQVYFDLEAILDKNSSIVQNPQYMQLSNNLNLMFDNYNLLSSKIESSKGNYEFGSFLTDPQITSSLYTATGSYESAMAISLGVDLIMTFTEAAAETKKFKEDYMKLAKQSKDMVYAELDENLKGALIDAYLGIEAYQTITPMYRYDFNNGASLRVDNGILKYINQPKNLSRNLMVVDKRHDAQFHKYSELRQGFYSSIKISEDEKYIYIYANNKAISDISCKDCLAKSGYIIDAETGEIVFSEKNGFTPTGEGYTFNLYNAKFENDKLIHPSLFANNIGGYAFYLYAFNKGKDKRITKLCALDKNKYFSINGVSKQFKDDNSFQKSLFDHRSQFYYFYPRNNGSITLFWAHQEDQDGDQNIYTSSMLQIAKGEDYQNPDGMVNELSGLAMTSNGDLIFTSKDGRIGRLLATEYNLTDLNLTDKIRQSLGKKTLADYDFTTSNTFVSGHGELVTTPYLKPFVPQLKITPDDKTIIYIIKDSLYIVDATNLDNLKRFKLPFIPYGSFFTKEYNGWVLNIQGWNEYKFPIVKKYSIDKLISNYKVPKKVILPRDQSKGNKTSTTQKSNNDNSNNTIAKEIKELKELLDQGIITQEEFEAGKKKILNSPASNPTGQAKGSSSSTGSSKESVNANGAKNQTSKNCASKTAFKINGQTCYGIQFSKPNFLGKYTYKHGQNEIRTWKGAPEEPIVILNPSNNFVGIFQFHEPKQYKIKWWVECDENCEPIVTEAFSGDFKRYILIIEFLDGDKKGTRDRISLDEHTNGQMTILGERVK